MEKIIQQLANNYSNENRQEALGLALKEVVLSGLSRSGFLKESFYLSGLDHFEGNTYCLCFLRQNENGIFPFEKCLPLLKMELTAFGIDSPVNDSDYGFSIEFDNVRLVAYIYKKDFDFIPEYAYQQVPLAYEIRSVNSMKEGDRNEIHTAMMGQVFAAVPETRKKKGASKAPSKKKSNKEELDHWVQPSLFDF